MKRSARVSRMVAVTSLMLFAVAPPASSAPPATSAVPPASELSALSVAPAASSPSVVPAAPAAGMSWSSPATDLSAVVGISGHPQIALSADGTHATAIWSRDTEAGALAQSASATIAGGVATWGAVTDLVGSESLLAGAEIALSADGTHATAVWSRNLDFIMSASATIAGNTATWGAAVEVSTIEGHGAAEPQIALSADGTRATITWYWSADQDTGVMVASATIADNIATWGALSNLSDQAGPSQIALSADGTRAAATWIGTDGVNDIAQASSATITGNSAVWSTPTDLSAVGGDAAKSQIALSDDGAHATAIWTRENGDGVTTLLQASSGTITGNTAVWGASADISAAGGVAFRPQFGLSADGSRATAIWYWAQKGQGYIAQASSATITANTGTWGAVSDLSASGDSAVSPQIAVSRNGSRATATWYTDAATAAVVQTSSATITGTTAVWSTRTDLSDATIKGINPQVAMSANGTTAVIVWHGRVGTDFIVQAAAGTVVPSIGDPVAADHFTRTWGSNYLGNPEKFWVAGGVVWHSFFDGVNWSADAPLGGPSVGIKSSQVGFGLNYLGDGELFVVGADGDVYHNFATPGVGSGWNGWDSMGHPAGVSIVSDVSVDRQISDNQELFVVGSDGLVYHTYSTPGAGTGWSEWSPLGAPAAGIAGGVHVNRNEMKNRELFVVANDGQVYHSFATPGSGSGWSAWSPLGAAAVSSGDVAVWQNWQQNQELFLVGSDGQLSHMWATPGQGSGWSGWFPMTKPEGATLSGFVGLDEAPPLSTRRLYVKDTSANFWYADLSAASTWSDWTNAGATAPTP